MATKRPLTGPLPFRVELEREDRTLTSHAGLPLALSAFSRLGLDRTAREHLQLKQRDYQGPSDAEWAAVATMVHVAGGSSPAELDHLKEEPGLRRVWPLLDRVSARSLRDHLARFDDPSEPQAEQGKARIEPESPGLVGLGKLRDKLVAEVQRRRPVRRATLELDAYVIDSWKRAALFHYEGSKGYQPTVVYWGEQRLIVCDQLRDGNVPASLEVTPLVMAAFGSLPASVVERLFRADSACYDHRLLRWCDRSSIRFGVSADMSEALSAECRARPATMRRRLIQVAGRLVRHANRLSLVLAAGATALSSTYALVQQLTAG